MQFELRLNGRTIETFGTADEALAQAGSIIRDNADQQPEVIDTETGEPGAPAASSGSREHLARKVGF